MYYDAKTKNIINTLPVNAYDNNQTLVQNLPFASLEMKASCGYYTINEDFPQQPENSFENIEARIVSFNGSYVNIIRKWIIISETIELI
jgi:hypothetical protein